MAMCFQLHSILSEAVSVLLVEKAMRQENARAEQQAAEEEVRHPFRFSFHAETIPGRGSKNERDTRHA